MKNLLLAVCLFLTTSCVTTLPPEPRWQTLTKDPFIDKIDGNFLVTSEYVKLSEQRRIYISRVRLFRQTQVAN
jgi:hypothetical protein